MLNGIGVSGLIAIGKVVKYIEKPLTYCNRKIEDTVSEKQRFLDAVTEFSESANALAAEIDTTAADGQILRGYTVMIKDPYLNEHINLLIDEGNCAEKALESACDRFIKLFTDSTDDLVRHRAADIEDIKRRMLEILLKVERVDLSALPKNSVLVTNELTPSMTVSVLKSGIVGIIAEKGGRTSHSAIIARSLKLPTVLGVKGAMDKLKDGENVALDGETGEIFSGDEEGILRLKDKKKNFKRTRQERFKAFLDKETLTADRQKIRILANIDSLRDIDEVKSNGAEGIGLFRTEGLFLDRGVLPSEDEQTAVYKVVAEAMNGQKVIIRSLDVGGDKQIPSVESENEDNPFLGLRAIRYSIKNQGLFRTQLRAVLRASAVGNISLMIPLVTRVDEVLYVKGLFEKLKAELDDEGIPYDKNIELGVMIETPAAVQIADVLAENCDFFSIGTNDLIGYTMAVDRGNPMVSYLYSAYEPAVLRAIKSVISVAKEHGIKCSMCGEAATDEKLLPLLLAFGLREFSVVPSRVLPLRAAVSKLDSARCNDLEKRVMRQVRARAVEEELNK